MNSGFSQFRSYTRLLVLTLLIVAACDSPTDHVVGADAANGTVASADGVPISYSVYGVGSPALALIHGWSCDRSYWSEQVGPLSADHQVITIDLGGHGESGLGREDWTIASFGADVAAVVESLGVDSVVLVGHSMGGDVIFQAERLLPGKVAALIMLDTYKELGSWNTDAEIEEIVAEFAADFSNVTDGYVRGYFAAHTDPSLIDRVATDMAAAPPTVALSAIRSSFKHAREIPGLIRDLSIPVATINPDDAPTDLVSMSEYDVEVVIMPGVGHFLMMEDPDRFNELLSSTLDDIL
jgi:pimeloyl-ACP methyl ester carboxylesterase